jgi:eukaryotic-like serine/threonine-protein kinase
MDIECFITLVAKSGLIDKAEIRELARPYRGRLHWWKRNEARPFCDFLISTNRLTNWQCDKLLMGKYKGFYLDNYVLLGQVGKDYESSSYKARDLKDGKFVRLVVTPVNQTGGRIEYRVEPFVES